MRAGLDADASVKAARFVRMRGAARKSATELDRAEAFAPFPFRDRFGSFVDEAEFLGIASTRVEEASSKQHRFAPKRSGLDPCISTQVRRLRDPPGDFR